MHPVGIVHTDGQVKGFTQIEIILTYIVTQFLDNTCAFIWETTSYSWKGLEYSFPCAHCQYNA